MSKKTYAVMGATGHTGHVLTEKLLAKGHQVKALGRDPKKLAVLKEMGAEVSSPAFDDEKALTAAFQGADAAFVMIPPNYGVEDFAAYQDRVREIAPKAVGAAGVKYVVSLSSIGAELSAGSGPIVGLHKLEQNLNQLSGVNILHLRPGPFMENQFWSIPTIKGHGINGSTTPGDIPMPMVATRDIGEKAAELLDALSFKGQGVYEFTGPKEYTLNEVTAALGRAIGKPDLKYVQFSYADAEKAMLGGGMKPKTVSMMMEMYKAGNEGKLRPLAPFTPDRRGKTTIEEFAKIFAQVFG